MSRSTVPGVKRELASRLATKLEDLSVPVYRGLPDKLAGERYCVVSKAKADQEWAALGGSRRRQERYRIGVVFQVGDVLGSIESTSNDAYELLGRLEEVLVEDPTLGGLAITAELEEWEDDELPADRGAVTFIGATVLIKARTEGIKA